MIFPCRQQGRLINFYGRSIGAAFPHRLLPRSKGGLFAWESVSACSSVILVEGLFDLASLWQAGFRNTTCGIATHLTPAQCSQLCDQPGRYVYIAFDQDLNHAFSAITSSPPKAVSVGLIMARSDELIIWQKTLVFCHTRCDAKNQGKTGCFEELAEEGFWPGGESSSSSWALCEGLHA